MDQDDIWKTAWMFNAFWSVLYYALLVAIAVIWRPTTNNMR